jgi:hypothetical protein
VHRGQRPFQSQPNGGRFGCKRLLSLLGSKSGRADRQDSSRFKVKGFQKRYIFKRAFEKFLPEEILRKKKHGFGLTIARWLHTHSGFREMARSLLLDPSSVQRGFIKPWP